MKVPMWVNRQINLYTTTEGVRKWMRELNKEEAPRSLYSSPGYNNNISQ